MEKRHILVVGERHVGKSTLIRRLLDNTDRPVCGFMTKSLPADEAGFHPIYIHPAGQPTAERVYTEENCIGVCDSRTHRPNLEVFDGLGVRYVRAARPDGVLVMDELGFFEAKAEAFTAAVLEALSGDVPVIAAVKSRRDVSFLNAVRSQPRAEVFYITPENRDVLYERLLPRLERL